MKIIWIEGIPTNIITNEKYGTEKICIELEKNQIERLTNNFSDYKVSNGKIYIKIAKDVKAFYIKNSENSYKKTVHEETELKRILCTNCKCLIKGKKYKFKSNNIEYEGITLTLQEVKQI